MGVSLLKHVVPRSLEDVAGMVAPRSVEANIKPGEGRVRANGGKPYTVLAMMRTVKQLAGVGMVEPRRKVAKAAPYSLLVAYVQCILDLHVPLLR